MVPLRIGKVFFQPFENPFQVLIFKADANKQEPFLCQRGSQRVKKCAMRIRLMRIILKGQYCAMWR